MLQEFGAKLEDTILRLLTTRLDGVCLAAQTWLAGESSQAPECGEPVMPRVQIFSSLLDDSLMQRLSAEEAAFDHSLHLVSHAAAALRPSVASHSKGDFQKLPDDILAGYPVERFEFAAGLIQESTKLTAPRWVESRENAEASWGALYTHLARKMHAKQAEQVAKLRQGIMDLAQGTSKVGVANLVQELRPAIAAVNHESWQKPLLAFLELGANLGPLRQATSRPLLSPFSRTGANRAELEAAAQRVKNSLDVLAQVSVFEDMGFEKTGLETIRQEATNLLEKAKTYAVSQGLAALNQATKECVDAVEKVPDPSTQEKKFTAHCRTQGQNLNKLAKAVDKARHLRFFDFSTAVVHNLSLYIACPCLSDA